MGLDWFGIKPAVGFNGLVKVDAPVKTTTSVTYNLGMLSFEVMPPKQVIFKIIELPCMIHIYSDNREVMIYLTLKKHFCIEQLDFEKVEVKLQF